MIGSEGIKINREREDERSAVLSNSKIAKPLHDLLKKG